MTLFLENNYINKILAHKKLLISELTNEFGIQYEKILNERFDKIGFITVQKLAFTINRLTKGINNTPEP